MLWVNVREFVGYWVWISWIHFQKSEDNQKTANVTYLKTLSNKPGVTPLMSGATEEFPQLCSSQSGVSLAEPLWIAEPGAGKFVCGPATAFSGQEDPIKIVVHLCLAKGTNEPYDQVRAGSAYLDRYLRMDWVDEAAVSCIIGISV